MVGIAADALRDMASIQPGLTGVRLLSDLQLTTAKAWGLHQPGADSPYPATYLVGGDGVIRWRFVGANHHDWPTYSELVAALDLVK